MKTWIQPAALLASLAISPLSWGAESAAGSPQQQAPGLQLAVSQPLYELYKEDLDTFTMVQLERPDGEFINGNADGVLQLSSLKDLGVSFLAENSGGRPLMLTLGVWLPNVGIASEDEEEQQAREDNEPEKTWLDEETVLRQAYSGRIEGAQMVRLYVRADKVQGLIEQRELEDYLSYPPEEGDEAEDSEPQDAQAIVRPADATTPENRPDGEAIRELDEGLLVFPSPQVKLANAVRAGVAEPVYPGGYR